jgi:hypothetical protein
MHKIHADFVRQPVFCKLSDLFVILDRAEPHARHEALSTIYPIVFRSLNLPAPSEEAYESFKAWLADVVRVTSGEFAVFACVGTILAWLATLSDETQMPEIVARNEAELRKLNKLNEEGKISDEEFGRQERVIKEGIERFPNDQAAMRELYEWFCTDVVDRIPRG